MFLPIIYIFVLCGAFSKLVEAEKVGERIMSPKSFMPEVKEYPFMVFISHLYDVIGSGSILSRSTLLSSAQVLTRYEPEDIGAFAGTVRVFNTNPEIMPRAIIKIAVPDEDDMELHDIGVAFVDMDYDFDDFVQPVPFWIQSTILPSDFVQECLVLGFGYSEDEMLQHLHGVKQIIGNRMICPNMALQHLPQLMCSLDVLHITSCFGDSGGPVLMEMPVIGLVQVGLLKGLVPEAKVDRCRSKQPHPIYDEIDVEPTELTTHAPCVNTLTPHVYVFLGFYRDWLLGVVPDMPDYQPPNMSTRAGTMKQAPDQRMNRGRTKQRRPMEHHVKMSTASVPPVASLAIALISFCLLG